MTITIEGNKVYFVYASTEDTAKAFRRLRSLDPRVCSRNGGEFNALVVDMEKMPTMGEMQ